MKMLNLFLVFLFLLSFASALDAEINCPAKVQFEEEFECSVLVSGGEGIYDLKIDLSKDGENLAEIFDSGKWKSAYYYINQFIEDEETNVKLKIVKDFSGEIEGILKLRQESKREFFYFDLNVGEDSGSEDERVIEDVEEVVEKSEEIVKTNSENKEVKVISLNSQVIKTEESNSEKVVYESKNEKIKNFAIYGFAVFLIFVIVVLLVRG